MTTSRRPRRTFRATVARAFVAPVLAVLAVLLYVGTVGAITGGVDGDLPYAPAIVEHGSATDLVERHGCWTSEAPADMVGVIPGHVVVTTAEGVTRYGAERLVDQALRQQFEGADHGLVVHGFCR